MVWGDFQGARNVTLAGSLLRYQKQFARLVDGSGGLCHADPLFSRYGMLKVGDLYRQQLRVHAWRFWNGRLPVGQAAMLSRASGVHGHATRAARLGMFVSTRDHEAVGYRVPVEWASIPEALRGAGSLVSFKRGSRAGFLAEYGASVCGEAGCGVCMGPV